MFDRAFWKRNLDKVRELAKNGYLTNLRGVLIDANKLKDIEKRRDAENEALNKKWASEMLPYIEAFADGKNIFVGDKLLDSPIFNSLPMNYSIQNQTPHTIHTAHDLIGKKVDTSRIIYGITHTGVLTVRQNDELNNLTFFISYEDLIQCGYHQ